MTVSTLLEFPGVTLEQYEAVGEQLAHFGPPDGILHHACGPTEDGWRIMDIWESEDAFDRFVDGTYLPAMEAAGGPAPSRREVILAHHAGPVERPPSGA